MHKYFLYGVFIQLGGAINRVFYGEGRVGEYNKQHDTHRTCTDFIVVGPIDLDSKKVTGKSSEAEVVVTWDRRLLAVKDSLASVGEILHLISGSPLSMLLITGIWFVCIHTVQRVETVAC